MVIDIGISDHSLIFCTRKQTKTGLCEIKVFKKYNSEEFQMNLLNTDWTSVMCADNVMI